ncbi:MAG: response regulator, partial [Thermodesulfobacteriota bacterium]
EERIRIMMERNGASRKEAIRMIHKLDKQRKKWSQQLYGIDTSDPSLYDMVIHIDTITVNDAVDIICKKVGLKRFQTTSGTRQKMEDLSLAADVKAQLIDFKPAIHVRAQNGSVKVTANESATRKLKGEERRKIADSVPGVKQLQIDTLPVKSNPDDYLCLEVLIVDDEAIVCERLKAFLESDGHRIETQTDPMEALRRLEAKAFDIVICDIRMGAIDGIQVMEKVIQKSGHTKVIMITGYATLELAREALTKGAFDFIAKPFKMKEIRKTIRRAAESMEQGDAAAAGAAGG